MEYKVIVGLALLAAFIIMSIIWVSRRRPEGYSNDNIITAIRLAYAETGQDPNELDIRAIEQIQREDMSGRSIYDAKIGFLKGENVGKVRDFRYGLKMLSNGSQRRLVVETVEAAPADSPIKR